MTGWRISELGGRLRELRAAAGLTQEQLAEKAGVSKDVIAKLEQGSRTGARSSSIVLLASALGVTMGEFWTPRAPAMLRCGSGRWPGAPEQHPRADPLEVLAAEVRALRAEVRALARREGGQQ